MHKAFAKKILLELQQMDLGEVILFGGGALVMPKVGQVAAQEDKVAGFKLADIITDNAVPWTEGSQGQFVFVVNVPVTFKLPRSYGPADKTFVYIHGKFLKNKLHRPEKYQKW
ncbi:MAG: hypothetical protein A2283_20350 [Lentisphaerae bacterium RIFOXYA12_FULL_48_11]|nr:MAG: hypothetical protein A2283_20350 [Lentisphaerae bacterium RIFOXYA12_FULL_48_11]